MKIDITKKLTKSTNFKSKWVQDRYDLDLDLFEKNWKFEFEFPEKWEIGLIVGNSGSGKSIVSRQIFDNVFQDKVILDEESPLVEAMGDHSIEKISNALVNVGMGSIPQWLTPYKYLSTGQKMRADLAFCLLNVDDTIVFDEFTSVVDRQVAKIISHSICKTFRTQGKKFVAVSCHTDIEEWMEPDWVLDMDLKQFRDSKKKGQKYRSKFAAAKGKYGIFSKIFII